MLDLIFGRKKADTSARKAISMPVQRLRGRYDAAQTTQDNFNHWSMADALSADAGMTPAVRRVLRNRARYEASNNSYCRGIVLTLSNDVVGTGPRIKVNSASPKADRIIEKNFHEWMESISLADKLRTIRHAQCIDGEAFAMMITNPRLEGVQLDVRLIECDQIATPTPWLLREVDGIEYDSAGNPDYYHLLKKHPGALYNLPNMEYDRIEADMVMHVYRASRPGQHRGISEITPALPLFAMLRRYTLATLAAAETAADFAAVLFTNAPANELPDVEPFVPLNIQPRSMMALPEGWQLGQMQSEQPTTTYGNFKTEILNEIARCLNMPFNIAACNSSSYNYSSGRLDHQTYFKSIRIDRECMKYKILNRVFRAWVEEASTVRGLVPDGAGPSINWNWTWVWDGSEHVDPQSEALAQQIALEAHTTTLAAEYAKLGKDWEVEVAQRARELDRMRELGMLASPDQPGVGGQTPTPMAEDDGEEEQSDEEDEGVFAGDGYKPPRGAREEAARGLAWRREYGRGGTAVGIARARDIAAGKSLSADTIKRMVSFFARHEVDKQGKGWSPGTEGYPSNGRIAHALWGGDAGRSFAAKIAKKLAKQR
jgi:lambda family phage portal protein